MIKTATITAALLLATLFAPAAADAYTISVDPTVSRERSALIDTAGGMAAVDARVASTTVGMEPVNFTLFAENGDDEVDAYFDVPALGSGIQLWFFDGGHWINLANGWNGPAGGLGLSGASAPITVEIYPISNQLSSFEAKVFLKDEEDDSELANAASVITFTEPTADPEDSINVYAVPSTGTIGVGQSLEVHMTVDLDPNDNNPVTSPSCLVNGVDVTDTYENLSQGTDGHFKFTYTVSEGDAERAAGQVPIDCDLEQTNQVNISMFDDSNAVAIDSTVGPGNGDNEEGQETAGAEQFDNTATTTSYTLWIPDGSPTTTLMFSTSASTSTGESTVTIMRPLHGMFFVGTNFIEVQAPASTTISATSTWNGAFVLPRAATGTTTPPVGANETASVALAIALGSDAERISFDKGVRLLLADQAGKRAGFWENGSFTEITETCSNDWQSVGDSLAVDGSCKIDVGPDLVIWTRHFTTYIAYTVTANSGGSNNGGSSGGSGGASTANEPFRASGMSGGTRRSVSAAPTATVGQGQVLGAATYRFSSNVSQGMSGESVRQLQERLRAEGYFTYPTSTGYFGPMTLAAVQMYQAAKGIPAIGFVGPLTIAELNRAPVATISSAGEQGVDGRMFVELLIGLGVIGSDKAMAARAAVTQ